MEPLIISSAMNISSVIYDFEQFHSWYVTVHYMSSTMMINDVRNGYSLTWLLKWKPILKTAIHCATNLRNYCYGWSIWIGLECATIMINYCNRRLILAQITETFSTKIGLKIEANCIFEIFSQCLKFMTLAVSTMRSWAAHILFCNFGLKWMPSFVLRIVPDPHTTQEI